MSKLVFLPIALAVVGAVLGAVAIRRSRRAKGKAVAPARAPSPVRVLTTDEELRDAVRRAVIFEQALADRVHTRTRRYEEMVNPAQIARISPVHPAPLDLPDDTPRSA